jgi:hypothetical protein
MFRAGLFTLFLAAGLLLCLPAWGREQPPVFSDIKGSFAEEAINGLAARGMIKGDGPGRFNPDGEMTRGDFTVLLAGVLGVMPRYPEQPSFSDVPPDSPYHGYVEAMAGLDIIKGGEGNKLDAGAPIIRQDAAVMVYRALGAMYAGGDIKFLDGGLISPYARTGVAFVSGKGWMRGGSGYFYPRKKMTRAEAAVLAGQLYDVRKQQAMTSLREVTGRRAGAGPGAKLSLQPGTVNGPLGFIPTYGIDNPALGSLGPDGTFVAGRLPGNGIITVNSGYCWYNIEVAVSGSGSAADADISFAGGASPVEKKFDFTYTVEQFVPDAAFHDLEVKKYSGPVDGLASDSEVWTGFLRQQGRDITADLGRAENVSEISLEFKQDSGAGILMPEYMECSVSLDGELWRRAGRVNHGVLPPEEPVGNKCLQLTFAPVAARYVKVSFPVDVFVFARHLSVRGGFPADISAVLPPYEGSAGASSQYLLIPGMKDILLVFSGANGSLGSWTPGDFSPLVGYIDGGGSIRGRMFDTMLFLPFPGTTGNKVEWNAYLDDLYAPDKQLSALNTAAATVNEALHTQVKEKVILTLPYPDPQQKDFGAVEDGGRSLSFEEDEAGGEMSLDNRFKAVQWYYNQLVARWHSADYENLELAGIYWYKETMDARISGERELVQNVARMVRQDGLKFFWIPYYGARGYEDWQYYGFNHVILQPNYYATDNPPEDRLVNAAGQAGKYRLGIELECDDKITYSRYYYDLFYRQLDNAHELGLDVNATNAYYAGAKTLLQARSSSVPQIRAIYDDVYKWISGAYVPQ